MPILVLAACQNRERLCWLVEDGRAYSGEGPRCLTKRLIFWPRPSELSTSIQIHAKLSFLLVYHSRSDTF